ncbi:MarR family transcriptional regulator, partial [Pseudoalteromonas sp. S1688]
CSAIDFVNQTHSYKAHIARLVKVLLALNLILKNAIEHDKRCYILSFTAQGCTLNDKILNAQQHENPQMSKNLNQKQIKDFLNTHI